MNNKISILLLTVAILLLGCTNKKTEEKKVTQNQVDTLMYAEGFTINKTDSLTTVKVLDVVNGGKTVATYYLVKDSNVNVPADGVKVKIPVRSIASASVTHLEFLRLLGEIVSVKGFCTPTLAYNATVLENFENGKIVDLGDALKINIEKTLALHPDMLMASSQSQADANIQRIAKFNIPVVYNNEWMEQTPLGRAEWIKFIAEFYDKSELADSIFMDIVARYNKVKSKVGNVIQKPTILSGANFRGTWYMPGGKSYVAKFYKDAGASYFYENNEESGSLSLDLETVLKNFSKADYWLFCNFKSMDEMMKEDKKYGLFEAVKQRNVYSFDKKQLPSAANDYWESGIARPDLVLADIAAIVHPELFSDYELVYAKKVE